MDSSINPECVVAIRILLEAYCAAVEVRQDPWEFATNIQSLHTADVSDTSLRWLVCRGYAEHRLEIVRPAKKRRLYRPINNLAVSDSSCFVLTASGRALAQGLGLSVSSQPRANSDAGHAKSGALAPAAPHWDRERRELWYRDRLVKRYRVPAPNQEVVLEAFEEEGWPAHIDDPLPPRPGEFSTHRRLHDTISKLNSNQTNSLVHFRGDGSGEGVCWETRGDA